MKSMRQRADHRRRQEREQHADDEARAPPRSVNMLRRERPEPAEIDRQQRQDGAELDQHREGLAEGVVAEAEEVLHQQQMAGRGHRQEFGQALDDAEHDRLDQVDMRASWPGAAKASQCMRGSGTARWRRSRRLRACGARPPCGAMQITARQSQQVCVADCALPIVRLPRHVLAGRQLIRAPHADAVPSSASARIRASCGSCSANTASSARLVEERFWERREEFLMLNPAGDHPGAGRGRPAAGAGRRHHRRISRRDAPATKRRPPAAAARRRRSASRCAGWRAGSTTNSTPRSAARW